MFSISIGSKKLFEFPKLMIAAVNGYALGGGFDLAVLCHLRVASKGAVFSHPEIGFGAYVPFSFHTWHLWVAEKQSNSH